MTALDSSPPRDAPESVAGFTIIRALGSGDRADVYLAAPRSQREGGVPRALKLYRSSATRRSIDDEIEALDRSRGEHVVDLVDLATGDDGTPVLVLARVPGPSLARLLADREDVAVGEAITLLAPMAATVARMHESGVVHSAIRASSILIDERGAPILCGFGAAELITPHPTVAARDVDPGVRRDNEGLAGVVAATLARVDGQRVSTGLSALHDWMREAIYESPAEFAVRLEDRLFDLAEPTPLRSRSLYQMQSQRGIDPGQLGMRTAPSPTEADGVSTPSRRGSGRPGSEIVAVLRTHLTSVRPRFWVAAGAATLATAAAILLAGTATPDPAGDTGDTGTTVARGFAPPSLEVPKSRESAVPAEIRADAIAGDDPVLATGALIAARAECFATLSLDCLDTVDQRDSTALALDRDAIEFVRDGGEIPKGFGLPSGAPAATLTQRLGDTALVSLTAETTPASILIVRSEAGWRIRELLTD